MCYPPPPPKLDMLLIFATNVMIRISSLVETNHAAYYCKIFLLFDLLVYSLSFLGRYRMKTTNILCSIFDSIETNKLFLARGGGGVIVDSCFSRSPSSIFTSSNCWIIIYDSRANCIIVTKLCTGFLRKNFPLVKNVAFKSHGFARYLFSETKYRLTMHLATQEKCM